MAVPVLMMSHCSVSATGWIQATDLERPAGAARPARARRETPPGDYSTPSCPRCVGIAADALGLRTFALPVVVDRWNDRQWIAVHAPNG